MVQFGGPGGIADAVTCWAVINDAGDIEIINDAGDFALICGVDTYIRVINDAGDQRTINAAGDLRVQR